MNPMPVSWIPAHPAYDGVSMDRYRKLLEAEIRQGDPFSCVSILPETDGRVAKSGRFRRLISRRMLYPAIVKLRATGDIVHILDHSWADLLPYTPRRSLKIVTVHDLIPLRFPGELTAAQAARFRSWVDHLRSADAIIAVSAYTKDETVDLLGIDGGKIHVVMNGVELPETSAQRSTPGGFTPNAGSGRTFRIGSIGSTLERKNLAILAPALGRLRRMVDCKIVLARVGAPLPAALATALREALGDDGLVELGRLPDAAIGGFYAGLDVVVVPSFYEGFGLPVIEGMAARVPVVASHAASLPEVGLDLAYYFDPHSADELAAVLAGIVKGGVPASRLDAGYARAKDLSWRKCLEGIYRVYDEALAAKKRGTA